MINSYRESFARIRQRGRWHASWTLSALLSLSLILTLQLCHAVSVAILGHDRTSIASIKDGQATGETTPWKPHPSCGPLADTSLGLDKAVRVVLKDRFPKLDMPVVAALAWGPSTVARYPAARPAYHLLPSLSNLYLHLKRLLI